MNDLGALRGYPNSHAAAISSRGIVVGESIAPNGKRRTVIWRHGRIARMRSLGGGFSTAVAVNGLGQVVGTSVPAGGAVVHAFFWQDGRVVDLGTLGGAESDAAALNEMGGVVGVSATARGVRHAVLWTKTGDG
jgi:probable HAF family extracellular repeat protein